MIVTVKSEDYSSDFFVAFFTKCLTKQIKNVAAALIVINFKEANVLKNLTPKILKSYLADSIEKLLDHKEIYLNDPEKAFSRTKKISFHDAMLFPMVTSGESTSIEMLDYFPKSDIPSQAAMIYRRDQIKVRAFHDLFMDFTSRIPKKKTFHGMHLIACDGTRLDTPYNPLDTESFVHCIEGRKGFNQYHLITCHDVLNDVYVDASIQGYFSMNETLAFCEMMDRFPRDGSYLFVTDRGFSSYNVIAHALNNGHHFVMRLTSSMAKNVFCDNKELINEEPFDLEDDIHVGRIRTRKSRSLSNYHFLRYNSRYDYIPDGSEKIDKFHVRLVMFELPGGTMEYLLTDLPKDQLTLSDLQEIYRLRWDIETSFRHLKYASGLKHIHSLKRTFIFQEIYAKLLCYNFCAAVYKMLNGSIQTQKKHLYVPDKTYMFKCCLRFLKNKLNTIEQIVQNKKAPVRAGRKFERIIRRQHVDALQYR